MKKFKFLSFLVLLLTLLLVSPSVVRAARLSFEKDEVLDSSTVINGVYYENYTANSVNDEGVAGKQNVNMVSVAPGSAQVISWAIPSGNGIRPSTVMEIAEDYETKHPNMMVVAAINNDYFGKTGDVFSMRNPSVCGGVVYRASGISNMYGLGIAENNVHKLSGKGEVLPVSENYILDIYDPNGLVKVKSIELSAFNAIPADGQTSVCYNTTAVTEYPAGEIFAIDTTSASRIDSTYYIEGKISGAVATMPSGAAILTADEEVANLLASNAKVKVYKTLAGEWADYDFVLGCPAQTLRDGEVLTVPEIGDYGTDHVSLRHPRTSIGFKEDGTMVLMVIDGRQPNDGMDGVSERENALALKNEGCVSAFNFDGGGSSTLIVRKNGKLVVANSPSDGYERSDANALLVVAPKAEITLDYDVTVNADGSASIKGSADIQTLHGFEYTSSLIYINGLATEISAENFEINDLVAGKEYAISVMLLYKVGTNSRGGLFYSENVTIDGTTPEFEAPEIEDVHCEATATGFKLKVSVNDPLQQITSMTAQYNGRNINFIKAFGYFTANVYGGTPEAVNFDINYSYRQGFNSYSEAAYPFSFTFGETEPEKPLVDPEGFEVKLTEQEDEKYEVEVSYVANDATSVQVYAVIDDEEVLLENGVLIENTEFDKLIVKYALGDEQKELEVTDFELEVITHVPEEDENGGGNAGGGMACNFGATWAVSVVSLLSLAILVIKRKQ